MQFRRRWIAAVMLMAAGMAVGAQALPASAVGVNLAQAAHDLETLKPEQAPSIKDDIVKGAKGLEVAALNDYAKAVCEAMEPLLASKKQSTAINAMMAIVELKALDTDATLERAVGNANPAVRYWAVKGLGADGIMPRVRDVGGGTLGNAVAALNKQMKVETSIIIQMQIIKALVSAEDTAALAEGLSSLSEKWVDAAPDTTMLATATAGIDKLKELVSGKKLNEKVELAALTSMGHLMSLAAQHELSKTTNDGPVPAADHTALVLLMKSGAAMGAEIAKVELKPTFGFREVPKESMEIDQLYLMVNDLAGSPNVPGDLQKSFPKVALPPAIKSNK